MMNAGMREAVQKAIHGICLILTDPTHSLGNCDILFVTKQKNITPGAPAVTYPMSESEPGQANCNFF